MTEDADDLFVETDDEPTQPETEAPAPQVDAAITIPPSEPQSGIMQGLAKTIPAGGTTLLAISRLADDSLLISIQPARAKDEDASSTLPLQVKGTPEDIDRELLGALSHYVPAREYVLATAEETARATMAAATARAAGAKKPASTPTTRSSASVAPKKPELVALKIDCKPAFAKVTVADAGGKQIAAVSGTAVNLAAGTYTISASAAKHDTHTETLELRTARTVAVSLTESAPAFAFVGEPA